mgnify:CR=1 FL=1
MINYQEPNQESYQESNQEQIPNELLLQHWHSYHSLFVNEEINNVDMSLSSLSVIDDIEGGVYDGEWKDNNKQGKAKVKIPNGVVFYDGTLAKVETPWLPKG